MLVFTVMQSQITIKTVQTVLETCLSYSTVLCFFIIIIIIIIIILWVYGFPV